jgi:hypothetical protein
MERSNTASLQTSGATGADGDESLFPTTAYTNLETIISMDVIAREIFAHLPRRYRFVAGVNKSLRDAYRKATVTKDTDMVTSYENAVASPRTTAIFMTETAGTTSPRSLCHWQFCTLAARYGRLTTLQWLVQDDRAARPVSFMLMTSVCKEAAKYGQLDCLRYLHERGWSWCATTCRTAAEHGQLACLIYAHENNCPWDEDVTRLATENDSFDCLIYATEHGCP